jgi:hypothetical protein
MLALPQPGANGQPLGPPVPAPHLSMTTWVLIVLLVAALLLMAYVQLSASS